MSERMNRGSIGFRWPRREVALLVGALLATGLPATRVTAQPKQFTIDEILTSLRGGTTPGRLVNILLGAEGTCVIGGRLNLVAAHDLQSAGATPQLLNAIRRAPCPDMVALGVDFSDREFSRIQPGRFYMGEDLSEHLVEITRPFQLQRTEVTQRQWALVMGTNPSSLGKACDNCPVEMVSWDEVQTFLSKLNAAEPGRGYRLPTEAEWEYAARATTGRNYNVEGATVEELGWTNLDADGTTHPVAQKRPNAFGLYDMHGNVWEWVQDYWGPLRSTAQKNPSGPSGGSYRVIRGGSWDNNAFNARSASRSSSSQSNRSSNLGLRLARNP